MLKKNHHFWTPSRWTQKSKNRAFGEPRGRKKCSGYRRGCHFWPGGSEGPPRARGLVKKKNDRGADEQLVQDLTRHGPMARRIFDAFIGFVVFFCIYENILFFRFLKVSQTCDEFSYGIFCVRIGNNAKQLYANKTNTKQFYANKNNIPPISFYNVRKVD